MRDTFPLPISFERTVWVREPACGGVRLSSPLLRLEVSDADGDGVLVVTDTFSSVYGAGEDLDLAIRDYLRNLFDHFEDLDRSEDRLGPGLKRELMALRRRLQRVG